MGTVMSSLKKLKPRYIGAWLKDQLSRPDRFQNLVVNRSAWGAFSIYAHVKRSDGKAKISYKSKEKAEKAALDMSKRHGHPFTVYKCLFCEGWHVSRNTTKIAEGKTQEEKLLDDHVVKVPVESVESKVKRSDGKSKISYDSKEKAEKAALDMSKKEGHPYIAYKCLYCDGWHVRRDSGYEEKLLDDHVVKAPVGDVELDVDRILSTNIPDLRQVYGGFRGRTLSSTRQLHAWETMIKSGVNQVIDLRADYSSEFYGELCKRSGINYFKYPVAYDDERIAKMVELFPEFCKMIDNGRFYIACAMGLHRTDIALCTYWVFYAADKGIAPPRICGYRKDKGHNTDKIMRILNAFYQRKKEVDGKEPMSEVVFKERKNVINELSKKQ